VSSIRGPLQKEFGIKVQVDLVIKNNDGTDFSYRENIESVDGYIPEKYTREDLEKLIIL
jgi:UDP-N-acetylglucosamine kinase